MVRSNSPFFVPPGFGGASARYARNRPDVQGTKGVLTISWDFRPIIKLAARMAGEAANADAAIRLAHTEMASAVQQYAAEALAEEIGHRGPRNIGPREQLGQRLFDAIEDDSARRVDGQGFTVGYLDDSPARLYWRRIEEGSATQVGQVFYGAFLSADGHWSWPTPSEAGQVHPKLFKFASGPLTKGGTLKSFKQRALEGEENTGGRTPIVHIRREIPAYHYLARGFQKWLGREGSFGGGGGGGGLGLAKNTIISTYGDAFATMGLEEFSVRWFKRFGAAPTPASARKQYGSLLPGSG